MAKQNSVITLKGTIGNITFYKSKAGNLARQKGGVDGERIASDPAFARTRENGSEFGRAGKAGKLLRNAFRMMLVKAKDSYMAGRLQAELVKVIQADATSLRGQRNVIDGESELLQGFEFNINSSLKSTLYAQYLINIDRSNGRVEIGFPSFIPANLVASPLSASFFRITAAAAEIDFEKETFIVGTASAKEILTTSTESAALNLQIDIPGISDKPLFVALGIEFFQPVNGVLYSLRNGAYNPLSLVRVSGGV